MNKFFVKKIVVLFLAIILVLQDSLFAKSRSPFEGEVAAPSAEKKQNTSEGILYNKNPFQEYSPINPVPAGTNIEEKNSVDNYNIDIKTLETRIKYFSPIYTNAKETALSKLWLSFYSRGGSLSLTSDPKQYSVEYKDQAKDYQKQSKDIAKQIKELDPKDPNYAIKLATYNGLLTACNTAYATCMSAVKQLDIGAKTVMSKTKMKGALTTIGNVDNNGTLASARETIVNQLTQAVLRYDQLAFYVDILEKQQKLYYDMYLLKQKMYAEGLATALEVSKALDTYENAKTNYKTNSDTLKNVKELLAINLGYKLEDIDKLNFVEPEPDLEYIKTIDLEKDKVIAYNSNATYKAITLSKKDKKLPQSTGEELYKKRQENTSEKIITKLEDLYANLEATLLSYNSSLILKEIVDINNDANKRKRETNLVSDLEYDALAIQNLANELQVNVAKYNLINATNAYYYGVKGQLSI